MSNSSTHRKCVLAALATATMLLVSPSYAQESGGIYSLGISDDARIAFAWKLGTELDLAGYRLHVGTIPGLYSATLDFPLETLTPDANSELRLELPGLIRGMTYYFSLSAYNRGGYESELTHELSYTVPLRAAESLATRLDGSSVIAVSVPVNTPSFISRVPNLWLWKNRAAPPVPFTIHDQETPASELQVAVASSNPEVLPASGLILTGSGETRNLIVDPTNGREGVSIVTITVSDEASAVSVSFAVTIGNVDAVELRL